MRNLHDILISPSRLSFSECVALWLYFLLAPSLLVGLFYGNVNCYLHLYFAGSIFILIIWIIKRGIRYLYHLQVEHILLSFLFFLVALLVLYSPLIYNWDTVSVYLPIAKTIVRTGSLIGPNIYYRTIQTMYAPPLTPILIAFFIGIVGDWSHRLVPMIFSILMFLVMYDLYKLFTRNAITLTLASLFTTLTNPLYILYYLKESTYLDLGFIVMMLFAFYETVKIVVTHKLDAKQLLLWTIASALLISSKEYGLYVSIVLFIFLSGLIIRASHSIFPKIFVTSSLIIPFAFIYLWDALKLGISIGVISKLLGSSVLVILTIWLYKEIFTRFPRISVSSKISTASMILLLLCIALPILSYYVTFAVKYGVIGSIPIVEIQQKFIDEGVRSSIISLYANVRPPYDMKYLDFFAYDKIFTNIGSFIALASLLITVSVIIVRTRFRGLADNSESDMNEITKEMGLSIYLALMMMLYYLGAVDISTSLAVTGSEYRRVLPIIAILNVIAPLIIIARCKSRDVEKFASLWILINIFFHVETVNVLEIPQSYLRLLNPWKTIVSLNVIIIFFTLWSTFILLTLLLEVKRSPKRYRSVAKYSIKPRSIALLVMLIFTSIIITNFLMNHVLRYNMDPRWYDTIYSSITYNPDDGSRWIKIYKLLKDKRNATVLVQGAYPLGYFLDRPVIVYGNPYSIWLTTHSLLGRLMKDTSISELFIVENKLLKNNFSEDAFNLVKNILEVSGTTEKRTLITILDLRYYEVLKLEKLKN